MAFTQLPTGGVPNVDLITQTLAKLQPDSALQQYAAMHKNDPYILSLATAESNRRKALRTAAQGQNAGQMPTVADQNIAGMAAPVMTQYGGRVQTGSGGRVQTELPEDQGIAQIPTPNIQRMADGGIAGYDDQEGMAQGGMFNFAQQSEPVVRMSGGGAIPKYSGQAESLVRTTDGGKSWWLDIPSTSRGKPSVASALANQKFASKDEAIAAFDSVTGGGAPAVATAPADLIIPYGQSKATNVLGSAPPAPPPSDKAPAAPSSQGSQSSQGGSSRQSIKDMYEMFAGPKNVRDTELNQIQERVREQGEAETSAAQRQLDKLKEDITAQGEYGKDREAKLKAKEERIGKEEGQAGGLALLEAGLAMMSGTSPHAFANIGQGAMAGTAAYRKSLDKIADARDKLDDAYGRLEDVRFNQKNLNNSEIRKATADVDRAANAGLKSLTDFAVTRYGMTREDAKTMFTGAMQERVANIGADATITAAKMRSKDQSEYLQAIRGSGAIEQARKNVMEQVIKSNKYTPEEVPAAFEKEWEKTLQLNPALAKLAGTSGGGGAPVGGADFVLNAKTGQLEPRK
jgi:hypothetical protein